MAKTTKADSTAKKKRITVDWGDGPKDLYGDLFGHLENDVCTARFLWNCISTGTEDFMREIRECPHLFVWSENPADENVGMLKYFEPQFQVR